MSNFREKAPAAIWGFWVRSVWIWLRAFGGRVVSS